MKIGDKVKFKEPMKGEENLTFMVTNVNDETGRILIELFDSGMAINPTELVKMEDVELI